MKRSMRSLVTIPRFATGAALAGFTAGVLTAGWRFWNESPLLEFQAGPAASSTGRFIALAQSATIEGLGFGLLALVLASIGCAIARGGSTGSVVAAELLAMGAFFAWIVLTPVAESFLPFLAPADLVLLNLVGVALLLTAFLLHSALVRLFPSSRPVAPGTPGAPVALAVATLASGGAALWGSLSVLRSSVASGTALGIALVLLLGSVPLAVFASRVIAPATRSLAERLARGPLLPRAVIWPLALGFFACAVATSVSFELSPVSGGPGSSSVPGTTEVSRAQRAPAPNVVLVTIDTLRADHLGCYGYERPTSPFIDSLAEAGTRFADPVAPAAWTKPATGSILTGLHPSRHGALYHGSSLQIPAGGQTLAEAFQERGYVTAGFVSNPNVKAVFEFDRGFDYFFDSPVEDTLTRACIRGSAFGKVLMRLTRHQFNWKYENDVRQMNEHITAWLRENHEEPFFLYLHYIDPHIPYAPPATYVEAFEREHGFVLHNERKELVGTDLYDGEIRYTDDGLRELVAELEELDAWSDTLFVVTSDHGEEFFEHGVLGHGFSLYQSVIGVPLIFHGPGVPAGNVVEHPVQIVDLAATLVDLVTPDQDAERSAGALRFGDGRSFAESLQDPHWLPSGGYFLENEFGQDDSDHRAFVLTGIREGRWKLVLTEHNAFFPPRHSAFGGEALYDLANDPGEMINLIAMEEHRPLAERLLGTLRDHSEFLHENGFRDVEPAALTPEIEASLSALGYGGD